MNRLTKAFAAFATLLFASLLLARSHPFGNAGLYATKPTSSPLFEHSGISPEVRAILASKCADCHSMQTRAPIYGRLAPFSWLMERDILRGRNEMNLSSWENYSVDRQQAFKAKIVQQVKTHAMPLPQYRWIHWNARTTDADLIALTNWARGTSEVAELSPPSAAGNGDPDRGKLVFEKRCTGCHALEKNREGPFLNGVFGRTAGSVAGFPYSPQLVKARIVWNRVSLDQWLADPDQFVPGNNMEFHVPSAQERQDLISFLAQAK
jgi:cytochrome c